jgi:hypothetical protein
VNPEVPGKEVMQAVLRLNRSSDVYMGRTEEGRTIRRVPAEEVPHIIHHPAP